MAFLYVIGPVTFLGLVAGAIFLVAIRCNDVDGRFLLYLAFVLVIGVLIAYLCHGGRLGNRDIGPAVVHDLTLGGVSEEAEHELDDIEAWLDCVLDALDSAHDEKLSLKAECDI